MGNQEPFLKLDRALRYFTGLGTHDVCRLLLRKGCGDVQSVVFRNGGVDLTAVGCDDSFGNGQPDPMPACLGIPGGIRTVKAFKQTVQVLFWQGYQRWIGNRQLQQLSLFFQ